VHSQALSTNRRRGQAPGGRTEYVNCNWAGLWGMHFDGVASKLTC